MTMLGSEYMRRWLMLRASAAGFPVRGFEGVHGTSRRRSG